MHEKRRPLEEAPFSSWAEALALFLRERNARADILSSTTCPSITTLCFWRLTFQTRRVARTECERLLPLMGPLPV